MTDNLSPAQILANLPSDEREKLLSEMEPKVLAQLKYNWGFWARPNQIEPKGDWTTWLILAGRGFGKTRTGAETIRSWVCGDTPLSPSRCSRIALVAETAADARDVMVDAILKCHPKDFMPVYEKTNRKITWPNGAVAFTYNATEPDQLRGPQHDGAWVDELAKFKYMQDSWDQLQFGLRLGLHPKQIVTTTPRPVGLIKKLTNDPSVFVTRGATMDNAANLAKSAIDFLYDRYGGTRLGRQELEGEVLEDVPGALWTRSSIDDNRKKEAPATLDRIVIAVDPATSSEENSDETGIVAVGIARDADGFTRGYVLADRSLRGAPDEWAKAAVALYRELDADRIVAEKNQGGEMVEAVLKATNRDVPVTLVHASRGKAVRAEPISALYEQGRVHHVGIFNELEDQMCSFSVDFDRTRDGSPDRMDALVWGMTALFDKIVSRRKKDEEEKPYELKNITGKTNDPYKGVSDTSWMV